MINPFWLLLLTAICGVGWLYCYGRMIQLQRLLKLTEDYAQKLKRLIDGLQG